MPIPQTIRHPLTVKSYECVETKASAFEQFERVQPLAVVMSARWTFYLEGTRFDNMEGGVESGGAGGKNYVLDASGELDMDADLDVHVRRILSTLSNRHKVLFVNQIPEAGWDVRRRAFQLSKKKGVDQNLRISTLYGVYKDRNSRINDILNSLEGRIKVIKTDEIVCDTILAKRCINYAQQSSYYRDGDHPAKIFADEISRQIVEQIVK